MIDTSLETFMKGTGRASHRLTLREKQSIFAKFKPLRNNAPAMICVWHFVHDGKSYAVEGNTITRDGVLEAGSAA